MELEATGEEHDLLFLDGQGAAERAQADAEQNLLNKSRKCILPVPCPNCGRYQDDMAQRLKEEASINPLQVLGAVIVLLSLVPLAFDLKYWVVTVAAATAGLAVLVYGYVVAARFDPNAGDPERRKAMGQTHAVWGEQLAELLAANPDSEHPRTPDRSAQPGPSSQEIRPA
jgi:hypothetical protein